MKRKLTFSFIVAAVFGVYLAAIWRLPSLLRATGNNILILRIGLGVLGLIVALVALIYLLRKPAPPPPPKDAVVEELQKSLAAAEKKLAVAKVAPAGALGKLPVVLMLGPAGSTKTSTVVRSGLDVDLLVGDVFRDDQVVTTRGANLWFGRNTLFVETGRDIADDPGRWKWFLHRLQPARLKGALSSGQQAPRVAVVCFSCEALAAPGAADSAAVAARALRDRLGQIAQSFGVRLPVYVLFSKADRVPGFAEFVQNFTKDEGRVVLGATLPFAGRADGASHAERETRRLSDAWARLFSGLASRRIDVLARESAGERKPAAYEFPREVRKLSPAAVQFLVELCRPTELGLGPVLRGFYLTGVRAVVTADGGAAIPSLMQAREPQAAVAATSVFRPVASQGMAPSAPVASGGRKKPEWVFLSGLFQDVILADSVAMGVTRGGARISALRRTLAAVGIGLAATLAIGFTWSFFANRNLQANVRRAVAAAATLPTQSVPIPSAAQLATLDSLRTQVDALSGNFHDGAPIYLRWGLYSGDWMYAPARKAYFDHFARLLYDSTRAGLRRATSALAAPNAAAPYDSAYRLLRAYLVTTDEFARSTPELVGPALEQAWPAVATADSSARDIARRQFEFFGRELQYGNPYGDRSEPALVGSARSVLAKSAGITPIYMSIVSAASRRGQPVRLGAAGGGVVVNSAEVAPQFTKAAWSYFVDTALTKDLDSFLQGEPWVTGGVAKPPSDREQLARDLRKMYVDGYVGAWRRYVKSASIAGFASLPDADHKLDVLSKSTSPLLGMLLTVSENAVVDSAGVRVPLQPVEVVMPVKNKEAYIGGANQDYMDQLAALATAVHQVTAVPPGADKAAQLAAASAAIGGLRGAVGKLARQFATEPERELALGNLFLTPAVRVESLIKDEIVKGQKAGDASAVNAAAAAFCTEVREVFEKFPFSRSQAAATGAELAKVFKPTGQINQFFEQALENKVLVRSGGGYRPAPGGAAPTDQLLRFMNNARRITDALFPGGAAEPRVQFTLHPQLNDAIPILTMTFGDETFQFARGDGRTVTAAWRFKDDGGVEFSRRGSGQSRDNGTWAPLRMYWNDAKPSAVAGTKTYEIVLGQARASIDMSVGGGLSDPAFFSGLSCPTVAVAVR
ncbi:MAG TPA: ImcF-related family protein [Gemmatimonadaceae bacterium]|nr:ImcF-related family protein [Gemmatimonadaceae bacterium]